MNWKKNRLAISAATLVALLGVTYVSIQKRDDAPQTAPSETFPTIDSDKITSLQITRPDGQSVTLAKIENKWRVTAPVKGAAAIDTVKIAVTKMGDLESTGIVATKSANHARLEVDDAQAIKALAKAGDQLLADVRIGKAAGGNSMVRLADQDTVHNMRGSIKFIFNKDLKDWRDRVVTSITRKRIMEASFSNKSGTFRFVKDGDDWQQKSGPNIKKFDANHVKIIVSNAANLRAVNFAAPETDENAAGLNTPSGTVTLLVGPKKNNKADGGVEEIGADEKIVIEIGQAGEKDSEFYARKAGTDNIVLISKYFADRLRPDKAAFAKKAPAKSAAPPQMQPGAMPQMPAGHGDIPPELMKKLQEQLKQRQQ